MKTFFTADTHFGHRNIIGFDNRPFWSVEEMDAVLIQKWNKKVGPKDHVYVLGDFACRNGNPVDYYLKQLNGLIHLIRGNHDKKSMECFFYECADYKDMIVEAGGYRRRVLLSHYFIPFYNGSRNGTIMLYGHTHNSKEFVIENEIKQRIRDNGIPCNAVNVGCMHWDYEPVTLEEILKRGDVDDWLRL